MIVFVAFEAEIEFSQFCHFKLNISAKTFGLQTEG